MGTRHSRVKRDPAGGTNLPPPRRRQDARKTIREAIQAQPSNDAYLGDLAKQLVTKQVAREMTAGRGMTTFMRTDNPVTDFVNDYMSASISGIQYTASLQKTLGDAVRQSVKNASFVIDPLAGGQVRNVKQGVRIVVGLVKNATDQLMNSELPSPVIVAARQIATETRKAGLQNKDIATAIGSLVWLRAALPVFRSLDQSASLPENQRGAVATAAKILMKVGFDTGTSLSANQPQLKPVIDQLKGYPEKLQNWFLTIGGITQ
jgi:hypothetical protein